MQEGKTKIAVNGVDYFRQGWHLATLPGIRRYVIVPLLVNVLLMGSAFIWLFKRLNVWIPELSGHIPHWLQWLDYLIWPLAVVSLLLVFGYFSRPLPTGLPPLFADCWLNSSKTNSPATLFRRQAGPD